MPKAELVLHEKSARPRDLESTRRMRKEEE
jgi:hypothetical protein